MVENFRDVAAELAAFLCFDDEVGAFELSRDEIASAFAWWRVEFGRVDVFESDDDVQSEFKADIHFNFDRVAIDDVDERGVIDIGRLWILARVGLTTQVVFDERAKVLGDVGCVTTYGVEQIA